MPKEFRDYNYENRNSHFNIQFDIS